MGPFKSWASPATMPERLAMHFEQRQGQLHEHHCRRELRDAPLVPVSPTQIWARHFVGRVSRGS